MARQNRPSSPAETSLDMPSLDITKVPEGLAPVGAWAAANLLAIAREEAAGRRRPALTEPKLATWQRFRGRLTNVDLITMLFEDASILHPVPFSPQAVGEKLRPERLPEAVADAWLTELTRVPLDASQADYVADQARLLGLPVRLARSELPAVKVHHRVLELPGTGGQLAHHLVTTRPELVLHEGFVVACGSWQEMTLAGVIGLDVAAPRSDFAVRCPIEELKRPEHPFRARTFDYVVGVHPDKGGAFRVEDQLAIWFPTAKIVLV